MRPTTRLLAGLLGLMAAGTLLPAAAQTPVDRSRYPDYSDEVRPDYSLLKHPTTVTSRGVTVRATLPDHWNNADTPYFPPVVNQAGGSCGSASRICYMFNWEMNAYRGVDGSLPENQYPSHFTWLLTNQGSGKEGMAATTGVPNVPTYGGRTYSALFGNQDCDDKDYGWMTGYEKWYAAMQNRISSNGHMPLTVQSEAGREALKWWLYNHNGDTDFHAGGIAGIGVASGGTWKKIPSTAGNDSIGVTGMYYVGDWGTQVDHALTIVGYDDRIAFDLDGNGIAGEKDKDEMGAWIIVNSWGSGWCNKGFIYCPYNKAVSWKGATGYYQPEIYYYRKHYRPLRVLKVKMAYNHRSKMKLRAGISSNLTATKPERTIDFDHFKYAGNGDVPMLGRWADGKLHSEPMEFGYDLTDLTAGFDRTQPLKYFFIVETKAADTTGQGKVYELSLMDYEYDKNGVEIPFTAVTADGVDVPGQGKTTTISGVVGSERINAPTNLSYANGRLDWTAPTGGSGSVSVYRVYRNGVLLDSVPAGTTTCAVAQADGIYQVSAVYAFASGRFESTKSNTALMPVQATASAKVSLRFTGGGFAIPNVFKSKQNEGTIEFSIRPIQLEDGSQQVGIGWGDFLFQAKSNGAIQVGWANNSAGSVTSNASTLKKSSWTHVSLVVRGGSLTVYANGKPVGSVSSTTGSGLGGWDSLYVGMPGNGAMNCYLDEVRCWNVARTAEQIATYYRSEFANPTAQNGLLAYYKMNTDTIDGRVMLVDCVAGNNAPLWGKIYKANITNVKNDDTQAAFSLPAGPYFTGTPYTVTDKSSANVTAWAWTVPGAGAPADKPLTLSSPTLTFTQAGQQQVQLTVTGADGKQSTTQQTITVEAQALPVAMGHVVDTTVAAGQRVSFLIDSVEQGCNYVWLMPGSNTPEAYTRNATTTYNDVGTHTVTLRATNAAGTTERTFTVHVSPVAPVADFEIAPAVVVKGQPVSLTDRSKYQPTEWQWTLQSPTHAMVVSGQNAVITPTTPGIYEATLMAGNAMGASRKSQTRALVVCNADSKTGLNFTRDAESVVAPGVFAENGGNKNLLRMTLEFWARPMQLTSQCLYMGSSASTFQMHANASGAITVNMMGKTVTSTSGLVLTGAWHHYAVVVNLKNVYFYRDGVQIDSKSITGSGYMKKWTDGFVIGGAQGPVNGMIDEVRLWESALSSNKLRVFANGPLTNPDSLRTATDKLELLYNFDQSSGNVTDGSGNGYTGQRLNFGPDGDAWNTSEGVWCLDFSTPKDVTSQYLTNYQTQFKHTGSNVIEGASGKFVLSDWKIAGAVKDGKVTSQPHVNSSKNYAFTMESGWSSFPSTTNCRAWQVATLPAGIYTLSIEAQEGIAGGSNYLVANVGDTLATVEQLSDATTLGYAQQSDRSMTFIVPQESTVSLGTLFRMSGTSSTSIKRFKLMRAEVETFAASSSMDHNGDGTINLPDAVVIFNRVSAGDNSDAARYDHNADGTVNLPDGVVIINKIVSGSK